MEITLGPVEDIMGRRIRCDRHTVQATGYGAPSGETAVSSQPAYSSSSSIKAKGSGVEPNDPSMSPAEKALMAKRAAKLDALRNLAEEVYGVKITSDSYVRDFVLQNDTIRARVEAFIKGAKITDTRHLSDGSVEVEMELTLGYEFRQMFP